LIKLRITQKNGFTLLF